jgi:hypothetical protein
MRTSSGPQHEIAAANAFSNCMMPASGVNDPYIGTKMIDSVMKKYRKKGSQPVQEFRSEMYAKQRDGETCVYVWQRIKRNAQGLRSARRTIETMDLADALKESQHPEHVH